MRPHWHKLATGCLAAVLALLGAAQALAGTVSQVTFSDYTPLSSNAEIARRAMSPLSLARVPQLLAEAHARIAEQPVTLGEERFVVFVPSAMPAKGYALLVFVAPWNDAKLPEEWGPILDLRGFIYVSATHSGNDQSVLGRRMPLALLAEQNIARHYQIDSERIYVSGFSGGARVALRLALAYPDVFRGAIVNAGADPIGTEEIPLPPRDLFDRFARETRLVYVTGDQDRYHVMAETASRRSLKAWCVAHVQLRTTLFEQHALADSYALSHALDAFDDFPPADEANLTECRAAIEAQIGARLDAVSALIAKGDRAAAETALKDIDDRYGGLAAPRSVELVKSLNATK